MDHKDAGMRVSPIRKLSDWNKLISEKWKLEDELYRYVTNRGFDRLIHNYPTQKLLR